MMLDPNLYIQDKQNWNLEQLYKEKTYLEEYIRDYKEGEFKITKDRVYQSPTPDAVAKIYEMYLISLKCLIENKEKENKINIKYIELTGYDKIKKFLRKHDYFLESELSQIIYEGKKANLIITDGEKEYEFIIENVQDFKLNFFTDEIWIYDIDISYNDGKYKISIDDEDIYIVAENVVIKAIDERNTIYTYASIKYEKEQEKTFYYISNIKNLKIGDYVWVAARDTTCPGIVTNIEKFSYNNVPFPIKNTKKIIRRSSKEEYDEYIKKRTDKETYQ